MRKILFDLLSTQPNSSGKRHGGGKYGEVVFSKIVELGYPVSCYYDSSLWFNPNIMELVKRNHVDLFDVRDKSLSQIVRDEKIDAVYSPLPGNLAFFDECEVFGTIHGMRELEIPLDWFFFRYKQTLKAKIKFLLQKYVPSIGYKKDRNYYRLIRKNSKFHFVMVSNHSVFALKAYCPEFMDVDIKAFYSPSTSSLNVETKSYQDKFFLLVSANRWEKNNLRAIMALDELFSQGCLPDFKVRITGITSMADIDYEIKNKSRFELMGYVSEEVLAQLYHDAYVLVYPSLNEGFGYPPVEAMHYGTPVIASPFSSISEVCSGAVLYTNPYSVEEMKARLLQISDGTEREKFSRLAKERCEVVEKKQQEDLLGVINYIYGK